MKTETATAAPSVAYTAAHVILGWNVSDIASALAAIVSAVWLISFFWNLARRVRDYEREKDNHSQNPPSQ